MNIECKYKSSPEQLCIVCRIRFYFEVELSTDDKKEIINSLFYNHNVPNRYTEIYNFIANIRFSSRYYLQKDLVLTTNMKNGSCYVDMVILFSSLANLEKFAEENNLTVEVF